MLALSLVDLPEAVWVVLGLVPAVAMLVMMALFLRALAGKPMPDRPYCVACGHRFSGGTPTCTECGADLARPLAVLEGRRRVWSPYALVWRGTGFLVCAVLVVAVNFGLGAQRDAAIRAAPSAVLARLALVEVPTGDPRWLELSKRIHSVDPEVRAEASRAVLEQVVRIEASDAPRTPERDRLLDFVRPCTFAPPELAPFLVQNAGPDALTLDTAISPLDEHGAQLVEDALFAALDRGAPGADAARRLRDRLAWTSGEGAGPQARLARIRARIAAHPCAPLLDAADESP